MAEVVGIAASIITIAQAAVEAVRQAKTLYHTQEEFEILQVSKSVFLLISFLYVCLHI